MDIQFFYRDVNTFKTEAYSCMRLFLKITKCLKKLKFIHKMLQVKYGRSYENCWHKLVHIEEYFLALLSK